MLSSEGLNSVGNLFNQAWPMMWDYDLPLHSTVTPHFIFFALAFPQTTISSVQSLSGVRLLATPWIAAHQASLSIINSRSSLKLMSIESVMSSSHLILCHPLPLLPPIPPSTRVFSNESTLRMRWTKYWSFSFSIIPSKEYPGPISFIIIIIFSINFLLGFILLLLLFLECTGWISLQSKGLSRIFFNTTVQMHQFFGT